MSERAVEHEAPAAERSAPAAALRPAGSTVAAVERLQQTAGNAAVSRLLQRDETAEWFYSGDVVELALKDDITSKFSVSIRGPWSDPDLADLQAALALLTSGELKWVSGTEFVRVGSIAGRPDDDALTEVVGDGSSKKVQCADFLFGREAGKSGGRTAHGVALGTHGIVHECGHVIHFHDDLYAVVAARWKPIYDRLKKNDVKVSSEPKGNPAKFNADELLAEAFARFHTDAAGLKAADAGAHGFFSGGSHLKK
ncbi:MAG TPA: hypothetical protein VIF36_05265 [Gaiellaceae bacterium]